MFAAGSTVKNGTLYNAKYEGSENRLFGKTGTSQNYADAKAITWTYDTFGYVGFNRPDSNDPIPYKLDSYGEIMNDWRGNPIRMNGSHEPAKILGEIMQMSNEEYDATNASIYDFIPKTIEFQNYQGLSYPEHATAGINKRTIENSIFNVGNQEGAIIEKIVMPYS